MVILKVIVLSLALTSNILAEDCFLAPDAKDYRGTISVTKTGKTCQKWTAQSPHTHGFTPTDYPTSGLGDHNYCRNPSGDPETWCYTTDPATSWEYCDVEEFRCKSECYHQGNAADYRGVVSYTETGKECQKWTSQSPHSHSYTPADYPTSGLGDHNYCRNPSDDPRTWCYTTDPGVDWQYCSISAVGTACHTSCFTDLKATDYRGTLSVTRTGDECQRWSVQTPNKHSYTPDKYPNAGLGAHNYCRNPDNDPTTWCYTTTPGVKWEYCDVEEFRCKTECYHEANGADYRGTVSVTESGHTCQKWSSQSPQSHDYTIEDYPAGGLGDHNYCRNPSGDQGPWCYTTNPDVPWQYCNVGPAVDVCACVFPVDLKNVAQGKPASQSSTSVRWSGYAEKAVDGNKSSSMKSESSSCTQTGRQPEPWWKVDLGQSYDVYEVIITNRQDCCAGRLKNAEVRVGDSPDLANNPTCGMMIIGRPATEETIHVRCGCSTPMKGRCYSLTQHESVSQSTKMVILKVIVLSLALTSNILAEDCFLAPDAKDYRGTISVTKTGKTCQKWTAQSPHTHGFTPTDYPTSGLGDHNYCRNPSGDPETWCYTTDPATSWEYCDVEEFRCKSECYHQGNAADYRGVVSYTETGKECQKWTSQSPHSHSYTPADYPTSGLGDHNYCRNPSDDPRTWCYTTDPGVDWQYCSISAVGTACHTSCFTDLKATDYRGTLSVTRTGDECQRWSVQTPNKHSYTPDKYPNAGLGAHNYCRNPDNDPTTWCYTTTPGVKWEYCDVEEFRCKTECYHEANGADYRGTVSVTESGHTCQKWSSQSPQSHDYTIEDYPAGGLGDHNYCRNPSGDQGPWCYTTNPDVPWQYCNVGPAVDVCACVFPVDLKNVAQGKPASQSSTSVRWRGYAEKAVDGNKSSSMKSESSSCTQTGRQPEPWWKVDLGQSYDVYEVIITNRQDCCAGRLKNAEVRVGDSPDLANNPTCGMMIIGRPATEETIHVRCGCSTPMKGRCYSLTEHESVSQSTKMVFLKVIGLILALTSNIFAEDCFLAPDAEDYRGTISVTKTRKTCQKWTAQSPHTHGFTPTDYPTSGLGDHNYCRNPSGDPETWCYTTDTAKRWEYCDVEEFRCESECYNQANAADYRGVVSYTETGKECQKWTSQSPQSHSYTPAAYPTSGLGDHNYCRNPSDDPKTWCYTTDPGVRWQYCSISAVGTACPKTIEGVDLSCFKYLQATDYRGTLSVTSTGKKCQRWTVQTPNAHGYTPDKFPNTGLGAHNYCRNPGNDETAWCYTTEGVRWEYCDVEGFRCMTECYHKANGADYRGTVSVTESGHTCQKWSSQSPQTHSYTIAAYPAGGLGDHNYCRNPGGDSRTWCYTTTEGVRWEYCNVGPAVDVCDMSCFTDLKATDYKGTLSVTNTGKECQQWTVQTPNTHSYTPEKFPNGGLGAHNYCRNPGNDETAWCFTTTEGVRWEYCDVEKFRCQTECYHKANGADYRGTVSLTESGNTCQKWSSQSPQTHSYTIEEYPAGGLGDHNYCRNPGGDSRTWCYTTTEGVRWEYCNVGPAVDVCQTEPPPPPPNPEASQAPPKGIVTTVVPTYPPCVFPVDLKNVAQGKPASQSSTNEKRRGFAEKAVDGNKSSDMKSGQSCTQTESQPEPWWIVDLGQSYDVYEIIITNRQDCCAGRLKNAEVRVGDSPDLADNPTCGMMIIGSPATEETVHVRCGCSTPMKGQYVSIQIIGKDKRMQLCEVEVMLSFKAYRLDLNSRYSFIEYASVLESTKMVFLEVMGLILVLTSNILAEERSCFTELKATDYRGTVSVTINGDECQRWTVQTPNTHSYTPDKYPNTGLGAHNYCRNPDKGKTTWCYTTTPGVSWDYCDVEEFRCKRSCFTELKATDYRGTVSVTKNGDECQRWSVQTPNTHGKTPKNYPNTGLGAHNYCRNPDKGETAWCYTTTPGVSWDYCDVEQFRCKLTTMTPTTIGVEAQTTMAPTTKQGIDINCFTDQKATDYSGTIAVTRTGKECLRWTLQKPHAHIYTPDKYPNSDLGTHNFCRNPSNSPTAWCYTTDPRVRWEYCDVEDFRCSG
ncbi:apolipoprotein(a)-like [Glandiceps talaboti]